MKHKLTLHLKDRDAVLWAEAGESLLSALAAFGDFPLDAPCGGLGKCGKCLVTLRAPGREKRQALACQEKVSGPLELWAEEKSLLAERGGAFTLPPPDPAGAEDLGLAFDIGTTTIAGSLFDLHSGRRLAGLGEGNAQRRFGADVLSRISFAAAQGQAVLTECLRGQLARMGRALCAQAGRDMGHVRKIAAVGNTVMEHFLSGLPAAGLGAAPFRAESLFGFEMDLGLGAPVYLAPCAAGYVGGDVTAGLLALAADKLPGSFLLIDAGTNGEMVLGQRGVLHCCATAVGPAFEGAEIRFGMAGAPGAVNRVFLDKDGRLACKVLGGAAAKGICGAGLIDALALMLRLGALTEGGRLLPPEQAPAAARPYLGQREGEAVFFLTPDRGLYVTAGDVRRLQLAKAAVRAGAETLLDQAVQTPDQVFLAGGFGAGLRPESALEIGLLPSKTAGRIRTVGNSALAGAEALLLSQAARARAEKIRGTMVYQELSGDESFSEAYMEAMAFDGI